MDTSPHTTTDTQDTIFVDAGDALAPVNILMLKSALKAAGKTSALIALKSTDPLLEKNLRAFCETEGHHYLHHDKIDGEDVYYVRKGVALECATCSMVRTIIGGAATLAALVITTPYVIEGNPPFSASIAFALGVCFLPPVLYNNAALAAKAYKKRPSTK